jgi:cytoskeletal protein RodZ
MENTRRFRFMSLPVVLAAVFGLGFGASVFLNIQQHQRAEQDKKLLNGEIEDLRYQVKQDLAAKGGQAPSPSPEPSDSPTPSPIASPSTSPEVAGASTVAPATAVTTEAATLRSRADRNSAPVLSAKIPAGTVVAIAGGEVNGYVPVNVSGRAGYIIKSALKY